MKLSIIVSAYNISHFIGPCLESILNGDLDDEDFEVIVINDGSTDSSLEIISEIASLHSQVKVITQEHQGLGSARNTGIHHAIGEYLWFIDGDDLVVSENISLALDKAYNSGVDVLAFDFRPINEIGDFENWINFKLIYPQDRVLNGAEFFLLNYSKSYIWLYFFKRKIFIENEMSFHPSIIMEDSEIMPKIMAHCNMVLYYDKPMVCYRKREGSITNSKEEIARNHFYYSMVKVAESLRDFQTQFYPGSTMHKAIELKRNQINQMLFTNLVSNNYSKTANEYYVKLLYEYNILPFSTIKGFSPGMNLKFNLARTIVNINPLKGRIVYKKLFG